MASLKPALPLGKSPGFTRNVVMAFWTSRSVQNGQLALSHRKRWEGASRNIRK